jgi:hypothetical protein
LNAHSGSSKYYWITLDNAIRMPIGRFEKTLYAAIAILGVVMFASLSIVVNTANADVHLFFFDCFIALVAMAFFLLCFKIAKAVLVPSEPETTVSETAGGEDENM